MIDKIKSSNKLIEILFEDEHLVAFNKPARLLVIPTQKSEKNTLVNIVNRQYAKENSYKLHPCHRLDRETSGIILFAKGKSNQKLMMDVFKGNGITKQYIAFVQGRIRKGAGEIDKAIKTFDEKKHGLRTAPKTALTKYKVLETRKDFSIIDVQIVTGRTNQIRIHFKSIGHPLVGDRKYSFARDYALKFKRTALHAAAVSFRHPATQKKISISLPLPKDMEDFIGKHSH